MTKYRIAVVIKSHDCLNINKSLSVLLFAPSSFSMAHLLCLCLCLDCFLYLCLVWLASCASFVVCLLSVPGSSAPFASFFFYGLFAICISSVLSAFSVTHSVYVFSDLLHPHLLWLVYCFYLVRFVCVLGDLSAMLVLGLSALSTFCSLWLICCFCLVRSNDLFCSLLYFRFLWFIYYLCLIYSVSIFYGLSTVLMPMSFISSTSSIACSVWILSGLSAVCVSSTLLVSFVTCLLCLYLGHPLHLHLVFFVTCLLPVSHLLRLHLLWLIYWLCLLRSVYVFCGLLHLHPLHERLLWLVCYACA